MLKCSSAGQGRQSPAGHRAGAGHPAAALSAGCPQHRDGPHLPAAAGVSCLPHSDWRAPRTGGSGSGSAGRAGPPGPAASARPAQPRGASAPARRARDSGGVAARAARTDPLPRAGPREAARMRTRPAGSRRRKRRDRAGSGGREVRPLPPPLRDGDWLRCAEAPRPLAGSGVRPDGAPPPPWFASRTGEAGGGAAGPGPSGPAQPLTPRSAGTCCARWCRRTRGAGSASRTAPWASPSGTPSGGCTGTTAWPAAPSPSQVRAGRAAPASPGRSGRGGRRRLLREGPGRGARADRCVPRSEVPERLHRDRAAALPQGLVPAALLRAALRAAAGEPGPALPLLPAHPARRRSVPAPRLPGGEASELNRTFPAR